MISLFTPPQSHFSFCSPTTATLIVSWLLLLQLTCNYMGIAFFKNIVSIMLEHCLLFIY